MINKDSQQKIHLAEANYMVSLSRLSLCVVGVWPNLKCSRLFAIISNLTFTISVLCIAYFIVISQTTKLFLIGYDLDTTIDILCTADIPVIVAVIKMSVLRYDSEVVESLLYTIFEDWRSIRTAEQSSTMQRSARAGRNIAAACIGLAYGTSNVFLVLRLMLLREKQARLGGRSFLFESHFPVDVSGTPWFELTWLMQGICTFSATTAYSGIDGFFAVLVLHLCGQLTILRDEFVSLDIGNDGAEVKERIAQIAERHSELNKFAMMIERSFNRMFLIQILACLVQFCLQGYQIVNIVTDTTVERPILQLIFMSMYICYMSLDLYIYCYVAEKLRVKSMEISQAAYNCKWYNLKSTDTHDLIFIMRRAQYPFEITAGNFCSLSLSLFALIGKTSLFYLSVLLAVKERTAQDFAEGNQRNL